MGQYFIIVNKTKREYIHPHRFGDGLKLMEFGCSAQRTLTGLTLLLRQSSEGGGGDFQGADPYGCLGRWAGDEITIVGDYDESGLFTKAKDEYKNISWRVLELILQDNWVREDFVKACRTGFMMGVAEEAPDYILELLKEES